MPAIFGHAERLPVGEPGELVGELFALGDRQPHLDGETLPEMTRDGSFEAADLIQISDDALAVTARPPIGSAVTVGETAAQVVRHFEGGIAVEFNRLFPAETFNENITL